MRDRNVGAARKKYLYTRDLVTDFTNYPDSLISNIQIRNQIRLALISYINYYV